MKRLTIIILILLMFPVYIMANDKNIELNVTGQPPLNTADQSGFLDLVSKEAFRRIGYELKAIHLPAERGLVNSNSGIVDGEMSRVKGLDKVYKNLIRVPEKVMDWAFVGFSYKDFTLQHGWQDLSNKSVAYVNGWKIFEKNVPDTAEISRTSDAESLFNLLRRKRTDIILYERWGGHFFLHKMKMNGVQMAEKPLAIKEMYIYLHKKHKALVPLLSHELVAMKQDGSYQKLFNKYLMPFNDHVGKVHDNHVQK